MQRAGRWVVAVCVGAGSFVVCLWAARAASFGFLPRAEADRWVVATAFATTVAALVGTAAGWWAGAGQEEPPDGRPPEAADGAGAGRRPAVRQSATASDDAQVTQVAGDRRPGSGASAERPGRLAQRARAAGRARITQVGGNDGTDGTAGPGHGDR
ncbi:hypothetical protein [Streptomyces hyaluromycini]|uniref:hypothetical protein n=1 Tax=Streptomyces hyaluromycini TaxID=1377993 RepID=UPI0011AE9AA9|nr:hypothetical protein [Streptomyces hyaluromycini]